MLGFLENRKMPEAKDITGIRYGKLVAISFDHKKTHCRGTVHFWKFICDCGNTCVKQKQKVTLGETRSCGCYASEKATLDSTTHGLSRHPLWRKWQDIKNR